MDFTHPLVAFYWENKHQALLLKLPVSVKPGCREKSRVLRMPPAFNTTRGAGEPPKPHFWPDPWMPLPPPHSRNKLTTPHPGEQVSKGTCCLSSLPSCCSRGPHKVLPEFLLKKKKSGVRRAQKCPPHSAFRKEMEPGALTSGQPGLLELTMPSQKCSPPVPVPMN